MDVIKTQRNQEFFINKKFLDEVLSKHKVFLENLLSGKSEGRPELTWFLCEKNLKSFLNDKQQSQTQKKNYLRFLTIKTLFYQILKIARLFSERPIFFHNFVDSRGRLYTSAYPLNPMGNKAFTRKLFKFKNSEMSELDVHSQMLQLLGLFAASKHVLAYTKFLDFDDETNVVYYNGKSDLYAYLAWCYKKNTLAKLESSFYLQKFGCEEPKEAVLRLCKREEFKKIMISLVYGEERIGRSKKLQNSKVLKGIFDDSSQLKEEFAYFLAKQFESLYVVELGQIHTFGMQLRRLAMWIGKRGGLKNQLKIYPERGLFFINRYVKEQAKTFMIDSRKFVFQKPKKVLNRGTLEFENVYDGQRFLRSLLPNYIHSVDAAIMRVVLHEFRKKKIPIFPVHDAIYVPENVTPKQASKIYSDAVFTVFKEDPIKRLVSINNIQ